MFENSIDYFNEKVKNKRNHVSSEKNTFLSNPIPVVFHIVLQDPTLVTDDQIFNQLEILNSSFKGNPKEVKMSAWPKGIYIIIAQYKDKLVTKRFVKL